MTLAPVATVLYAPMRSTTMKRLLQTIHTPTFTEAARAASVACRPLPVEDGSWHASVGSLVERCVR